MSTGDLTSADIPIILPQKDRWCVRSTSGRCGRPGPTAHKRILPSRMQAGDENEHLQTSEVEQNGFEDEWAGLWLKPAVV